MLNASECVTTIISTQIAGVSKQALPESHVHDLQRYRIDHYWGSQRLSEPELIKLIYARIVIAQSLMTLGSPEQLEPVSTLESFLLNENRLDTRAPFAQMRPDIPARRVDADYATTTVLPLSAARAKFLVDFAKPEETELPVEVACDDVLRRPPNDGRQPFAHVLIDLDYDDETIEADFKVWLQGFRRHHNIEPDIERPYSPNDIPASLALFDVCAWTYYKGLRLTRSQAAENLSVDERTVDRIAAEAKKLIRNRAIRWLNREGTALTRTIR